MKKVIFLSLLLTSCYSVERNCLDFKTGVFEFSTSINDSLVTSTFTRTNEFEIEMYNGIEDSSSISWVNNCEFLLTKININSLNNLTNYKVVNLRKTIFCATKKLSLVLL